MILLILFLPYKVLARNQPHREIIHAMILLILFLPYKVLARNQPHREIIHGMVLHEFSWEGFVER
jgi:hypothetical protein